MQLIVQRSKLCLDFSCTYNFIHLIIVWIYSKQFPNNGFWWILFTASTLGLWFGGEYLCLQKELEPIILSGTSVAHKKKDTPAHTDAIDVIELESLVTE